MGLNERGEFEDLVQRAKTTRTRNKRIGIFDEHHFAYGKMTKRNPSVEIGVRVLLMFQFDVTADGIATRFFGTTIGCFHDTRTTASHDGEPRLRNTRSDLASHLIIGLIFSEPG